MSATLESGCKGYVHTQVTLQVHFPVDKRGNAHICCEECWLWRRNSRVCCITNKPTFEPQNYVGDECPLEAIQEEETGE